MDDEWEGDDMGVTWTQIVEESGGCKLWETWLWNGAWVMGWCVRVGWRVGRSGKGSDCDTEGRVTQGFGERGVHGKGSGKDCVGRGDTVIWWGVLRKGLERGGCVGREVGRNVWEGEGLHEGLEREGLHRKGIGERSLHGSGETTILYCV
jgi:hypothetical protein